MELTGHEQPVTEGLKPPKKSNPRVLIFLITVLVVVGGLAAIVFNRSVFHAATDSTRSASDIKAQAKINVGATDYDVSTILVNTAKANKGNSHFTDKLKSDESLTEGTSNPTVNAELAKIGYTVYTIPETSSALEVVGRVDRNYQAENPNEHDATIAEVDAKLPQAMIPNDPYYNYWQAELRQTNNPVAWDITTGNTNVIIGAVDSGIHCAHVDLTANCLPGYNFVLNTANGEDALGHGTAAAGVMAGIGNNALGIASNCWKCKLLPLVVTDSNDYGTWSNISAAIMYAADHGAKVINATFGTSTSGTWPNSIVISAAQYAWNKGAMTFVPASNSGLLTSSGNSPYIQTISAVGLTGAKYDWSNYGPQVDFAAPGTGYTTYSGGGYGGYSGTCASSSAATGIAGLIYSVNPNFTPTQVFNFLKNSASNKGVWDQNLGWGIMNAGAAVTAANGSSGGTTDTTPPSVPTGLTATATSGSQINLSWTASTDNIGVTGYQVFRDGNLVQLVTGTSFSDAGLSSNTMYSYTLKATDAAGNFSAASTAITATTQNVLNWTVAPYVSGNKTATTATVNFTTSAPTTAVITYYTKNGTHLTATDANLATHAVTLTGLTAATTYSYTVTATDPATGTKLTSPVSSFKTARK